MIRFFPTASWRRRLEVVCVVCVAIVSSALVLTPAYGDDGENMVNPQQRPDSSFIYDTSIAALGNADAYYDNQTVQVVGEAIGDNLYAQLDARYRWITLAAGEDDSTATISVYMSAEAASKIDAFGKYGTTGTQLQVRGVFNLTCSEHEGLTDIHAEGVSVVEKGKHHEDVFDAQAFVLGALAVAVGLVLMGVFYYLRERLR